MFMSQHWIAWRLGIGLETKVVDITEPRWECKNFVWLDLCSQGLAALAARRDQDRPVERTVLV